MPLSTLHGSPRDDPRKTRGQDGSLLLSCKTLAFSTFCRFSPAHRLYPFQTKERATKGPISGITALFRRWFEVDDRHKCQRRAAGISQVKSLSHNVHGPAEALQPTAICFGKMDKVELRGSLKRGDCLA